ncbi:hypothetical protein B0T14DRAFT_563448 [Immersiella caudata]|uniref:Clr5 domain-containing protein n=1 Tax=Immersiella caudata TaxID=314043 RepID=A0AA40C6S9_9PEZI|nr:hypothetical protein B0T14DRAFT_563448 [Immersiella caudata]
MSEKKEIKFINKSEQGVTGGGTQRHEESTWERLKPIILEKYSNKTLAQVKKEMKEEYGFSATTRQLVHHIGTVWGVKKYNKGRSKRPSPSTRCEDTGNAPEDEGHGTERESPMQKHLANHTPDSPSHDRQALKVDGNITPHFPQSSSLSPLTLEFSFADHPSSTPTLHVAPHSQATHMDAERRHRLRLLAGILFAYGDSVAFRLYKEICQPGFPEELLFDLVACTRAAQTARDAEQARETLQNYIDNVLPGQDDDDLTLDTLLDLQAARTYDFGSDMNNAIGQIEQRILHIIEDDGGKACLKFLHSRGPLLDIPLFDYLGYAVKRWNDFTKDDDLEIKIEDFLGQFLNQQRGGVSCLFKCLHWCISVLKHTPDIPSDLSTSTDDVTAIEATYQLLGTLWDALPRDAATSRSIPWIGGAESELGISAAELLATLACMIIAQGTDSIPSKAVIQQSRTLAERLDNYKYHEILVHFIQQVRLNNDRRIPSPCVANHPNPPTICYSFRKFAFASLGMQMKPEDYNAPIVPLVLGPPVIEHPSGIGQSFSGPSGDVHDMGGYQQGHHMATRSQAGADGHYAWSGLR